MTTHTTTSLTAFLLARIEEDEAAATAATDGPWTWHPVSDLHAESAGWVGSPGPTTSGGVFVAETSNTPEGLDDGAHIARHDPARVLAEVKAHRAIVEAHRVQVEDDDDHAWIVASNVLLRILASIYAAHPDYDESWRP